MEKRELKELILNNTPRNFCRNFLFDQSSYIFESSDYLNTQGTYHDFKCVIADTMDISPNNVALVGSSKFGFSMNPSKKEILKNFHKKSDIDVVIACNQTFEKIWKSLRLSYYRDQNHVRDSHSWELFSKFLVVNDKIEYRCDSMKTTVEIIDNMKKEVSRVCRIKNTLKYRIYGSWDDVEDYHEFGVRILQRHLSGPRGNNI